MHVYWMFVFHYTTHPDARLLNVFLSLYNPDLAVTDVGCMDAFTFAWYLVFYFLTPLPRGKNEAKNKKGQNSFTVCFVAMKYTLLSPSFLFVFKQGGIWYIYIYMKRFFMSQKATYASLTDSWKILSLHNDQCDQATCGSRKNNNKNYTFMLEFSRPQSKRYLSNL